VSRKSPIPHTLIGALTVGLLTSAIGCSTNSKTSPSGPAPKPTVSSAGGGFRDAPGESAAVFLAGPLEPGASAMGSVALRNSGDSAGLFTLSRSGLSDRPGPNGGRLSERLELEVLDITDSKNPAVVYTGGVAALDTRPLGVLAPGATRKYELRATALDSQTSTVPLGGGNPYEGSSTRISFRWRAVDGLPATRLTRLLGRLDRTGPQLRLVVAPRQSVLESGQLLVGLRCSEECRASGSATVPLRQRPRLDMEAPPGARRAHELRLPFPPSVRTSLRDALGAGRTVSVALRLQASDGAGNRSTLRDTLRLRPPR